MGSLFKRKNGTWYYQWCQNGKKKTKSLKTDDKGLAKKRVAILELKVLQGSYGIDTYKTTVLQCLTRFLEHKKATIKPSTYIKYKEGANKLAAFFRDMPARKLVTDSISEYIEFRKKSVTGKTIHEEICVLKGALKHAWADRLLDEIPVRVWPTVKKIPLHPETLGFYSLADIEKLKEHFKGGKFYEPFIFAIYTGCRRSEIATITVDDVDLATMVLRIRNVKTESDASNTFRYVPINPQLVPILLQQIKEVKRGVLFPWFANLPKNDAAKIIQKACAATGVAYKRFHGLRHTTATYLLAGGLNIREVMAIMGWTELSTAERYTHLANALNNKMNVLPF